MSIHFVYLLLKPCAFCEWLVAAIYTPCAYIVYVESLQTHDDRFHFTHTLIYTNSNFTTIWALFGGDAEFQI